MTKSSGKIDTFVGFAYNGCMKKTFVIIFKGNGDVNEHYSKMEALYGSVTCKYYKDADMDATFDKLRAELKDNRKSESCYMIGSTELANKLHQLTGSKASILPKRSAKSKDSETGKKAEKKTEKADKKIEKKPTKKVEKKDDSDDSDSSDDDEQKKIVKKEIKKVEKEESDSDDSSSESEDEKPVPTKKGGKKPTKAKEESDDEDD